MRSAILVLASLFLTVGAALPGAQPSMVPDGDTVLADAEALVAAVSTGPASARLLALAHANHLQATNGAPVHVAPIVGLPADLVVPVNLLWTATVTADAWVDEATAALTPAEKELVLSGQALAVSAPVAPTPGVLDLGTAARLHSDDELAAIAAKVDMGLLVGATVLVLQAIETALPMFPSDAIPASVGAGACAAGPSIYDEPGRLAIDGADSARFTDDYLLTIDLGGDDCYDNRAGGGEGGASVALDLGGNDVYTRAAATGTGLAQGAASLGVGVLVDVAGHDTYDAVAVRTAPQPGPVAASAAVIAQGAATLGVGLLVEGGGSDVFRAEARSSGNTASTTAQGGALLAGVGLLVNAGAGLDGQGSSYEATATSTLHQITQTAAFAQFTMGPAFVQAQGGAGLGGAGGLADATGDDSYDARGVGITSVVGVQGGANGGVGVLADAAGADAYAAEAVGDVTLSLIVNDSVFCWSVTVNVGTGTTDLSAQGGALIGVGVFADGTAGESGDSVTATALSRAVAHAEVARSASTGCPNSAHATASSGGARIHAQGAGTTGVGVLLGSVGPNTYRIDGTSDAEARALVKHGINSGSFATASSGTVLGRAHGAGTAGAGVLVDPAGDDVYGRAGQTSATQITTSGTTPGFSGTVDLATEGWTLIGVGWLLDLDGTDTYATAPLAQDNACWTQPTSGTGVGNQARGRDLAPPYLPLPAGCP